MEIYTFVNNWIIIWLVTMVVCNGGIIMEEGEGKGYYVETITALIKKCNDIELLDLIVKLLQRE